MNSHQANPPTKFLLPGILFVVASLTACSDNSESEPANSDVQASSRPKSLIGIWEQTGYGDILVVDSEGADFFQYTRQGCLFVDRLDSSDLEEIFTEPQLSEDGSTLVTNPGGNSVFELQAEKRVALPDSCTEANLITDSTPTATFEHLWHTFNDYYAFFTERGVDWSDQYAKLRPLVNDNLNDEELVEIIEALLEPLNDGHVNLFTDDDVLDFVELGGSYEVIVDGFNEQTDFDDIEDFSDAVASDYLATLSSYLDAGSEVQTGGTDDDEITWGTIDQQVGYLHVRSMSDLDPNEDDSISADLIAINSIMQQALNDLEDTSALIIDVRINGGGHDTVSLAIASYFTDQTLLVASKRARSFAGESDVKEAFISPATDTPYLNPIAIISSSDTGSAAEIFLIAMNALPQVTLVGENSNGIFSDILTKALPNGWEIGLSNEVYTDFQGINYEVTGVEPDVFAEPFSLDAIEQNTDLAIDTALEFLGF